MERRASAPAEWLADRATTQVAVGPDLAPLHADLPSCASTPAPAPKNSGSRRPRNRGDSLPAEHPIELSLAKRRNLRQHSVFANMDYPPHPH